MSVSTRRRETARSRIPTSNSSQCVAPPAFARCSAIAASRSTSSGSLYPELLTAMPALAVTNTSWPFDFERALQRFPQALRHSYRVARIVDVVEEHREFVAAEPRQREAMAAARDRIGGAEARLQTVRDLDQQPVGSGQPEAVTDRLEAIQAENDQRKLVIGSPARCD